VTELIRVDTELLFMSDLDETGPGSLRRNRRQRARAAGQERYPNVGQTRMYGLHIQSRGRWRAVARPEYLVSHPDVRIKLAILLADVNSRSASGLRDN
jgi:hypothetical protein